MKVTDSAGGGGRCIDEDDLFGDPKSWPPGFRFHPTDEELVLYYLKRKICRRRLKLNVIADVDVYKCDPEELPCKSVLKSGDRQWYFFSPRDRKYPNGGRSNRATGHGYWKATGKDRRIEWNSRIVGNKKTLVFYRGRAPSGERTDWVMHEYTMDEEEIKRCKYVQDSYALYKVYKKSGPGPKNGEQYGAPFREEEWADDCDPVGDKQDNQLQHVDRNVCGEKALINNQCQPEVDILDEILGFIADEPQINGEQEHGLEFLLPEVGEEVGNTRTGPTLGEAISPEPSVVLNPSHVQRDAPYSIGVAQSGVHDSPSNGIPEVTSGPNTYEQVADEPQEDNFLEMDDLTGPQPNFSDLKHVDDDLVFEDPDLYFDAAMFLHDMGPIDQGATSHPYYNFGGEMANHLDYHMQPSQLDYEFEPVTSQLWVHDQNPNICIPSKSNEEFMAPLDPGKFHQDGSSSNFISEERQNQDNNEAVDVNSWFSSPITALLGSVPTRPAFASENAIINRAFERMSSFSRARIPTVETDVARGTGVPEGRRNSGKNGGYLFLSILVAFCAVLWLLVIGTAVKVLKTFVGKFISS